MGRDAGQRQCCQDECRCRYCTDAREVGAGQGHACPFEVGPAPGAATCSACTREPGRARPERGRPTSGIGVAGCRVVLTGNCATGGFAVGPKCEDRTPGGHEGGPTGQPAEFEPALGPTACLEGLASRSPSIEEKGRTMAPNRRLSRPLTV